MDAVLPEILSTSSESMSVLMIKLPTPLPGATLRELARMYTAAARIPGHPVSLPVGSTVVGLTLSGGPTAGTGVNIEAGGSDDYVH